MVNNYLFKFKFIHQEKQSFLFDFSTFIFKNFNKNATNGKLNFKKYTKSGNLYLKKYAKSGKNS